jgi:hypothetical protein
MVPLIIIPAVELMAILELARSVSQAQNQRPTQLWMRSIGLVFLILGLPIYLVFFRH